MSVDEQYQQMLAEIYREGDADFFSTPVKSWVGTKYEVVHNLTYNTWFTIIPASGSFHERVPESKAVGLMIDGTTKTKERRNGIRIIL